MSDVATPPATSYGRHLLCELRGASGLRDPGYVAEALETAARACGARLLDTRLHPFQDADGGAAGVTGVVLLAESHISIHTWPEHAYAALDVFLCGGCDPRASLPVFERAFAPRTMEHRLIERGGGRDDEENDKNDKA